MWTHAVAGVLFALIGLGMVLLNLVTLPGTWVMLALATVVELSDGVWRPADAPHGWTFGPWILALACVFAILGEVVEFAGGAAGAAAGGAGKRGMVGALVGGLVGALVGTVAIPIPLFGTLVGAVLGCALGAIVGEVSTPGRTFGSSIKPAAGAVAGRILGVVGKTACGLAAWLTLVVGTILS